MFDYYESLGALAGLLCVWFATRQSIWYWIIGMISVSIYAFVFYRSKLYADMGLQIVYFILSLYGFYSWFSKGRSPEQALKISSLTRRGYRIYLTVIILGTFSLTYFLQRQTDASLPGLDSFCTSVSLVATVLQAKKKIENWWLWIFINTVYIGMYLYKSHYITSALSVFLVILSVKGLITWKRERRKTSVPL